MTYPQRKMKRVKLNLILASLIFLATVLISWYTSQTTGPHGGALKKVGDHYIEMKNPENYLSVYLLDKKMKTVSTKNIIAEARFFMPDSTVIDQKLSPSAGNSFTSKSIPGFNACKITFRISGNEISATFENRSLVASEGK
jgi:hypothetical protein